MKITQAARDAAEGLSPSEVRVLLDERFDPKGWEPRDPFTPTMTALVDKGLFRRANGRCGFEAFKDSFVVPTPLGIEVQAHLTAIRSKS